jgi:hypothetical protein
VWRLRCTYGFRFTISVTELCAMLQLTASDPLTLDEEYAMQECWMEDENS